MPDLFPTADQAEKDQNIADAATGKRSLVNHLGSDSFDKDACGPSSNIVRSGQKS
jgi:hypothetical protein